MRWSRSAAHGDSETGRIHRNGCSFLKETLIGSNGVVIVARVSPGKRRVPDGALKEPSLGPAHFLGRAISKRLPQFPEHELLLGFAHRKFVVLKKRLPSEQGDGNHVVRFSNHHRVQEP